MHQRRHRSPSEALRIAMISELLQGWRTVREISDRAGVCERTIQRAIYALAESRYLFKQHRETKMAMVPEYRIFPEAIRVRRR